MDDSVDGGSDCPICGQYHYTIQHRYCESKLLDTFAAAALTAIADLDRVRKDGDIDDCASFCYQFADAMLAERKRRMEKP